MVSVFGRRTDVDGPDGYVFFAADSKHPDYELVQNVVNAQMYVSEFRLNEYPVTPADVLHTGPAAFEAALNTVNIGKFNLGFASIGICEHAFYEAITHAHNRVLFDKRVTEFPHVRQGFVDAYSRLIAMKLFSDRAIDYFRSAGPDDRRYLLYNPITKMKVTTEGERVVDELWDIVAAKGFERDGYFEMAARDIRGLPKLEGTVHVNMGLVLKFMPGFFFNQADYDEIPTRRESGDDEFLFDQGSTRGLSKIQFHDWRPVYERFAHIPNVARFTEQADGVRVLLETAPPTDEAAAPGPRLPADARRALHPRRLRAADPRAGRDRPASPTTSSTRSSTPSSGTSRATPPRCTARRRRPRASRRGRSSTCASPSSIAERTGRVFEQVTALSGAYEMRP